MDYCVKWIFGLRYIKIFLEHILSMAPPFMLKMKIHDPNTNVNLI